MRLTHLADYAVVMMTAAARRDVGRAPVARPSFGQETGVPLPTAQKLMGSSRRTACLSAIAGPAAAMCWPGR